MRIDHLEISPARTVVTVASHDATASCPLCAQPGHYAVTTDAGQDVRVAAGPVALTPAELEPPPVEIGR